MCVCGCVCGGGGGSGREGGVTMCGGERVKTCPKPFKRVYYKRYIDDIFVLFEKPEQVSRFVMCMNKRHKNFKFQFETEKDNPFLFSMSRFVEKKINLQQVFSEKIHSVVNTLTLVAFQHLNTNLALCTHFYIDVSLLCLIFPNSILKLKH